MRSLFILFSLLFVLMTAVPAQSWPIYNAGGGVDGGDADTLDGLDSTAFTLVSTFSAYTSTAGNGNGAFLNLTGGTLTGPLIAEDITADEITAYDIMLQGVFGSGTSLDVSGAGTRCFFYPKKAAWRCGFVAGTEWNDSDIGNYSVATGYDSKVALGTTAGHAEGYNTVVTAGTGAHAEGRDTTASATGAHAEGRSTIASGEASHAEGKSNSATAPQSHVEGFANLASGNPASHTEGSFNIASAGNSHVGGNNSIVAGLHSFVHGKYIKIDTTAINSAMFGSYADATERDANPLTTPDTMMLANMDLMVDGLIQGKRSYAMLSEDQESSYILSSTFTQITSIQTYKSSSDITAASNSIAVTIDGDYPILTSFAIDGHAGHAITLAVFKNGTSITERTSRLGGGHEHPVSLANYSGATVGSGAITDLAADDAVYLIVDEAAGIPNAIYFEFNGSVQEPNEIRFRNFNYDGVSGHENKVYAFSNASGAYHAMTANVDDLPHAGGTDAYRFYNRTFKFPEPHGDYALGGTARIKIDHPDNGTGTHKWYFDKTTLLDNHASASITWPDNLSLVAGDILTFYIKSDEEGSHAIIHDGKISLGIPSN